MSDKAALHESNAVAYLCELGVSKLEARRVLAQCPEAARFGGAAYYYPDDLEACADCYLDEA